MNKIVVEPKDTIYQIITSLDAIDDDTIIIHFRKGSEIYENASNLEILKRMCLEKGKKATFEVEDENHKDFIDAINNNVSDSQITSVDMEERTSDNVKKNIKVSLKDKLLGLSFLTDLQSKKEKKRTVSRSAKLKYLIIAFIFILLLLGLFYFILINLPTAKVNLNVQSDVLIKLVDANASTNAKEVSKDSKTVPAIKVEVTEDESKTVPVTGEKETGEYAKGKITIYNKTNKDRKIKEGTEVKLISTKEEGLKYKIKKEVEIKAQEEVTEQNDDGETKSTKYGSADVEIVALEFGDKYNLDDGQKFEIDDFDTDEVVGENEKDIQGGSLEKVKVVTQEDLNNVRSGVEEAVRKKVKESLDRKVVGGQVLNEASIEYSVLSEDFDHKLDEEAENVTLKIQMLGSGLVYKEEDLDSLVSQLIVEVVPSEYTLNAENPEYEVAVTEIKDNGSTMGLQIKLRGSVVPNFNKEQIQKDLAGLNITDAQSYLDGLNNVVGYEIKLSPKLPGFLRKMPTKPENILIETINGK